MACKGRQGRFGVLPRTDQHFLESVRPWISGRHSCFYSSHAVVSLHPSVGPSRAPQKLHNHSNQDNFLPSQLCLPPWLRREGGGGQRHQNRHKKASIEGSKCAIIFWELRGLEGTLSRGPQRSWAGIGAGLSVSALPSQVTSWLGT